MSVSCFCFAQNQPVEPEWLIWEAVLGSWCNTGCCPDSVWKKQQNKKEKEEGSVVEMAPALGVFLPKILFKVDLTWVENQGFPTGGGICSVLSSRGKI